VQSAQEYDYVLVGGGLQNSLIALSLRRIRPQARVAMVERAERFGGNHLWCFHGSDVSDPVRRALGSAVTRRWSRSRVQFWNGERYFDQPYYGVESRALDAWLRQPSTQAFTPYLEHSASEITKNTVTLDSGEVLRARLVVDSRGPDVAEVGGTGYQKFHGIELLVEPLGGDRHGKSPSLIEADTATLMDARVDQTDGFRFFYVLPFSNPGDAVQRLFVEETFFSGSPALQSDASRERILEYVEALGYRVLAEERSEDGLLAMPYGRSPKPTFRAPLIAGYAGGWFHPGTGYSFPVAARLAEHIARTEPEAVFDADYARLASKHQSQVRYTKWLNRLLFNAFPADARWNVLERFHRLPEDTIRRFYALELSSEDKAKILCGRPPRGLSFTQLFKTTAGAFA
jgi:lycopene beta-cyclase